MRGTFQVIAVLILMIKGIDACEQAIHQRIELVEHFRAEHLLVIEGTVEFLFRPPLRHDEFSLIKEGSQRFF